MQLKLNLLVLKVLLRLCYIDPFFEELDEGEGEDRRYTKFALFSLKAFGFLRSCNPIFEIEFGLLECYFDSELDQDWLALRVAVPKHNSDGKAIPIGVALYIHRTDIDENEHATKPHWRIVTRHGQV